MVMRNIYWGRVVAGGLAAEFLLVVLVAVVRAAFGETAFLASILAGSAAMPFLLALWVCRGGRPDAMLNGALVGGVAVAFYIVLFTVTAPGQSQPLLYEIAHVLKIFGGLSGGFVAARRRASTGESAPSAV
jgi:putative intracellular protease/amidase